MNQFDSENNNFFENETELLVKHFEEMLSSNKPIYLDILSVEDIFQYYYTFSNYEKALQLTDVAIKIYPYNADIYLKKAKVLANLNDIKSAFKILAEGIKINSTHFDLKLFECHLICLNGEYEVAILRLNKLKQLYPEKNIEIENEKATLAILKSNFKDALSFLGETILKGEVSEESIFQMGFIAQNIDEPMSVIPYFEFIINQNPYYEEAWFHLGLLYQNLEMYENAIQAYDYCIAICDDYTTAYLQKALCFTIQKRYDVAIKILLDAVYYDAYDIGILQMIAVCYEELNQFGLARKYYLRCVDIFPTFPEALLGVGKTLYNENRFLESITYFQKAIEIDDTFPEAWVALANAEFSLGNLVTAFDSFRSAVNINAYDEMLWSEWAEKLYNEGYKEKAIDVLLEGLENVADAPILMYQIAAYYFNSSNIKEGINYLENALMISYEEVKYLFAFNPDIKNNSLIKDLINLYK